MDMIIIICLIFVCIGLCIKLILQDNQIDQLRGYIERMEREKKGFWQGRRR